MNWSEILLIQLWITLVIGLGTIETVIKFGDYIGWNANGYRDTGALATGLAFGGTKRAVSRLHSSSTPKNQHVSKALMQSEFVPHLPDASSSPADRSQTP